VPHKLLLYRWASVFFLLTKTKTKMKMKIKNDNKTKTVISKRNYIVLWHFFGCNSCRYEMLMSVLLVYPAQCTAKLRCVIGTYQLVIDIRPRGGNTCVRICSVTQQRSRTELHFRYRVPYSFGSIASPTGSFHVNSTNGSSMTTSEFDEICRK